MICRGRRGAKLPAPVAASGRDHREIIRTPDAVPPLRRRAYFKPQRDCLGSYELVAPVRDWRWTPGKTRLT